MSPEAIVTGISVSIILAVLAIWIAFKLAAGTRGIMKGIKEQFNEIEELRDDISSRLKDLDGLIELGKLNAAEHEAEKMRGGMGFGSPRSLALKRIQREDNPNAVVEVKGIVEQDGNELFVVDVESRDAVLKRRFVELTPKLRQFSLRVGRDARGKLVLKNLIRRVKIKRQQPFVHYSCLVLRDGASRNDDGAL